MQNETEKSNTLVSKSLPMKPTIFISFLFSMSKAGRYVLSSVWKHSTGAYTARHYLSRKKQGKNQSMYQRLGRFYRRIIVPQILTRCKRIITVSHFECNRISHFLHIDRQLLVAVHNGYSQHFIPIRNAQATTARYIKKHPYLFFLGNTDPKKNTARVLQAYGIY